MEGTHGWNGHVNKGPTVTNIYRCTSTVIGRGAVPDLALLCSHVHAAHTSVRCIPRVQSNVTAEVAGALNGDGTDGQLW